MCIVIRIALICCCQIFTWMEFYTLTFLLHFQAQQGAVFVNLALCHSCSATSIMYATLHQGMTILTGCLLLNPCQWVWLLSLVTISGHSSVGEYCSCRIGYKYAEDLLKIELVKKCSSNFFHITQNILILFSIKWLKIFHIDLN